jgi:addiction module HigA family antidote
MRSQMRPVHPGEVLREEYLGPLAMSANALALALGVPTNRITLLLREARAVTADTALRLGRYFGTTPEFWLTLQSNYDLRVAERDTGAAIRKVVKPIRPAKAG